MRRLLGALFAIALALSGLVLVTSSAGASTPALPGQLGYDVSFPQCSATLPNPGGFAVVGVNNGHPFSVNPCLAPEITWASTSLTGVPEFYVNTSNPGPSNNSDWPQTQGSPQICAGANSIGCSYDYGWNAAEASFQAVIEAETQLGAGSPTTVATSASWWLDVETGNAWQSLRTGSTATTAQLANDAASISGEAAYFASVGISSVGIYATSQQWAAIVGNQGAALSGIKVWMPGYATLAAAQAACSTQSFTGGRVAMIQYPLNGLDGDYRCGLVAVPVTSSTSVATTLGFTQQLSVTGESLPVTYVQSAGTPDLVVSPSGLVQSPLQLAPGSYSASGTMSTSNGLTGNFTYTLVVGVITQTSPTSFTATVPASAGFNAQIAVSGAAGTLIFTQTSASPGLLVSPSGLVTTTGALTPGTYNLSGSVSDSYGDTGTYSMGLVVGALTQTGSQRSIIQTPASASFTNQITAVGAAGPVSFTQTTGTPSLLVSPTGLVSTSGTLGAGSYVVRGVMSDGLGDTGKYFFNLIVRAATLAQSSPASVTVPTSSTPGYSSQITFSGATGALSFTQTSGSPSVLVSSTGLASTPSALGAGTYSAAGTVQDAAGDTGNFSISIVVSAPAPIVVQAPKAIRVVGHAVAGRTVRLKILGHGFFGRPTVVGPAGTHAKVLRDNGRMLIVRVSVVRGSKRGVHAFVIILPNGKVTSVRYVQR